MSTVIDSLERAQLRRVPSFQPGDRVKVHFQVIEGTRRRTQVFEGVVIKRQGHGARETFRVRERRYTGPEERVEPGLLHDPVAQLEAEAALSEGAVDELGETAEEVVDAGGAEDTAAEETVAEETVAEETAEAPAAEAEPAAEADAS